MRDKIFISYCHEDSRHFRRLSQHLKPLERNGYIDCWADTKIKASQNWREEIRTALSQVAISILLVSADFLASDFIAFEELPVLLEHTQVFPILIHPCYIENESWLTQIQFVNDIKQPLSGMNKTQREALWAKTAKCVTESWQQQICEQSHINPDILLVHEDMMVYIEAMENRYSSTQLTTTQPPLDTTITYTASNYELLDLYLQDLLSSPQDVEHYWIYHYDHIDMLDFLLPADSLLSSFPGGSTLLQHLKLLLLKNGWNEGGDIRLLWLPPFLRIGAEDSWGALTFLAEQKEKGSVIIASPEPIPYLKQKGILYPDNKGYYVTTVTEERPIKDSRFRCFKIDGLLLADQPPCKGETHWLFFPSHQFTHLKVNDIVQFKPSRPPLPLRDFSDIQNTRNIYIDDLKIFK